MLIRTLVQKSSQSLLDFFLPPHCLNCKALGNWLCQSCHDKIAFISNPVCLGCGEFQPSETLPFCLRCAKQLSLPLDGLIAATYFENNPIRQAIHFLKYNNHRAVAFLLGDIMVQAYQRYQLDVEAIVPVPLHPSRLRERGYNQSELLARRVGQVLDLPVNNTVLQRTRRTKPQVGLGISERRKNVDNAFSCSDKSLTGYKVLLIDDVWTTGSTLNACALALKTYGVEVVWGLTLAKAGVGSA